MNFRRDFDTFRRNTGIGSSLGFFVGVRQYWNSEPVEATTEVSTVDQSFFAYLSWYTFWGTAAGLLAAAAEIIRDNRNDFKQSQHQSTAPLPTVQQQLTGTLQDMEDDEVEELGLASTTTPH